MYRITCKTPYKEMVHSVLMSRVDEYTLSEYEKCCKSVCEKSICVELFGLTHNVVYSIAEALSEVTSQPVYITEIPSYHLTIVQGVQGENDGQS